MPLQNKNKIAYLGSLSLLFAYAEMMLPRFVPFFRLGLGNIVILLALNINLSSFFVLTIIKAVASCLMAGTLFSPFFLISISQSVASGLVMFGLYKIRGKWISIYGISMAGSAVSAFIQILLSSLYLGKGTFALLGPMLIFSIFSGLITAVLSFNLKIPETAPDLQLSEKYQKNSIKNIIFASCIIIAAAAVFMIKHTFILFIFLILGFMLQLACGRKIKLLPHLFMWIFIFLANCFIPLGKVLFEIGSISITEGAINLTLHKALKLSVAMCLSQCASKISFKQGTLISLVLSYFNGLMNVLQTTEGNIFTKIRIALQTKELQDSVKN